MSKLLIIQHRHPLTGAAFETRTPVPDDAGVDFVLRRGAEDGMIAGPTLYKVCEVPDEWSVFDAGGEKDAVVHDGEGVWTIRHER